MPRAGYGVRTGDAIREAAADLFHRRGYEATSLREVASKVGIQVGSLYNHISGKDELLRDIMAGTMDDLLANQKAMLRGRTDPVDRLRASVDCHIRFHADRARDVFIGNSELRALSTKDRRKVVAKRDEYQQMIQELVEDIAKDGRAEVLDSHLQVFAIIAMGTHVCTWYRPGGPLALDDIVETYTAMIMRQLGMPAEELTPAVEPAAS